MSNYSNNSSSSSIFVADHFVFAPCGNKFSEIPGSQLDLLFYGYAFPFIAVTVAFANINGIATLFKLNDFAAPTSIILLGIFIVDLLTALSPLPVFVWLYTINQNKPLVILEPIWCYIRNLLFPVLPVLTNNIGIWLVVLLTVQRYVALCWRQSAAYRTIFGRLKGIGLVIAAITFITPILTILHVIVFFRPPLMCQLPNGQVRQVCPVESHQLDPLDYSPTFRNAYFAFGMAVNHVVPIVTICICNALLFRAIRSARTWVELRMRQIQQQKRSAESRGLVFPPSSTGNAAFNNNFSVRTEAGSEVAAGARRNEYETDFEVQKRVLSKTTHLLILISTIYALHHGIQAGIVIDGILKDWEGSDEIVTIGNVVAVSILPFNFFFCICFNETFRSAFVSLYTCPTLLYTPRPSLATTNNDERNRSESDNYNVSSFGGDIGGGASTTAPSDFYTTAQ